MTLPIRTIKLSSGASLPILTGKDGMPLVAPMIYNLTTINAAGRSQNTQSHSLKAIRKLERWSLTEFGEHIEPVLCRYEHFNHVRILRLREYFETKGKPKPPITQPQPIRALRDMESLRRPAEIAKTRNSGQTTRQYLMAASSYIEWLMHEYRHPQAGEIRALFRTQISQVERDISAPRIGLSTQERKLFLKTIDLQNPDNPFPNPSIRLRNFLVLRLAFDGGCRIGEILAAEVGDINWAMRRFHVVPRVDQQDDSRKNVPKAKTRGRALPIKPDVIEALVNYVRVRDTEPASDTHPFIFVSHKGMRGTPITYEAMRKSIAKLKPILNFDIGYHLLRHTFNDRLSEEFDRKRTSETAEHRIRNEINGWSQNSTQAARYTHRHIRRKAHDTVRSLNERDTDTVHHNIKSLDEADPDE